MNTVTDNDLKQLKDLINSKFDKVFEELTTIKVDIATLKEGQNSLNKRLDETKEALSKRLDNLDKIALTVVGGIILALLIGLFKTLYPNLLG